MKRNDPINFHHSIYIFLFKVDSGGEGDGVQNSNYIWNITNDVITIETLVAQLIFFGISIKNFQSSNLSSPIVTIKLLKKKKKISLLPCAIT